MKKFKSIGVIDGDRMVVHHVVGCDQAILIRENGLWRNFAGDVLYQNHLGLIRTLVVRARAAGSAEE